MLKKILLLGTADEELHLIQVRLQEAAQFDVTALRIGESAVGALQSALAQSDVAIVCCRGEHLPMLDSIATLLGPRRPRILVCGEMKSPEATRLMVRIGVVDLLPAIPTSEELHAAIARALRDRANGMVGNEAKVISVLGASGGVGASFIACNLAHLAAKGGDKSVMLIDLDLTYAPIAAMLGLRGTRSMSDALEQLANLDAVALDGYAMRHESGLRLLSATPSGKPSREINGTELSQLIKLAREHHDLVVIAANRWLDAASVECLGESHRVLMVLGQSLVDLRNGLRLRSLLFDWLGIPRSVLELAVNRHSVRAPVLLRDIAATLGVMDPLAIPEDVELVRRSIDSATPLGDLASAAPLTTALAALGARVGGGSAAPLPRSALQRLLSGISRPNISWSSR